MDFLYPFVLYGLCVPLILFVYSFKKDKADISQLFDESVIDRLRVDSSYKSSSLSYKTLLIVLALLIMALARPFIIEKNTQIKAFSNNLVVAIDVSKSMKQKDVYPNRLTLAKQKLRYLVNHNKNSSICIILFTQDAYLLSPLSDDTELLISMINHSDFENNLGKGSNLFAAIEASNIMLKKVKNKNLLLMSDIHGDYDISKEVQFLMKNQIRLFALNISRKSSETLEALAHKSGGRYQDFTWGEKDIDTVLEALKEVSPGGQRKEERLTDATELFIYPLFSALMLLLFIFVKERSFHLFMVLLVSQSFSVNVEAGILDFYELHKAKQFYDKKEYQKATSIYEALPQKETIIYNLANALYRSGRYEKAIKTYKKILRYENLLEYKVLHNMANAYVKLQQLKKAKFYYKKSLALNAKSLSKKNLKALNQLLKEREKLSKPERVSKARMCSKIVVRHKLLEEEKDADYVIQMDSLVQSEEEKWLKLLEKEQLSTILQKIPTQLRSDHVQSDW